MKKILSMLLLSTLALSMFTACETDDDSNPTLKEPTSFVLNVPPYATNNVYDLSVTNAVVELTCSQPDYGFPAATTYAIQVTLDDEFIEAEGDNSANYITLETTKPSTKMDVSGSELNSAILDLWKAKNGDTEFPSTPIAVTIRLRANITNSDRGVCLSNVITLPQVLGTTSAALKLPANMYLNLSNDTWRKMPMVYGINKEYYTFVYFGKDDTFKFGVKEGEEADLDNLTIEKDASVAKDKDVLKVAKAGWYVVYIKTDIKSNEYVYTLDVYPGDIYVCGNTIGGQWEDKSLKFTAPADASGEFVSPALTASGEVRMFIKTKAEFNQWWHTEFTLYKGNFFYRDVNIPDNWEKDKGADYSVKAVAGNVIHLNVMDETGEVK